MANPKHVKLILKGSDAWNSWFRKRFSRDLKMAAEDPKYLTRIARPALRDADLRGADLSGIDLGGGKALRANLAHAKLADARLARCELSESNLFHADFTKADLEGTICATPTWDSRT